MDQRIFRPRSGQCGPPSARDIWALAGLAAFGGLLLAPLRHYVGDMRRVSEAKLSEDSFPLSTYPMFSADRQGRIVIPHVIGLSADGERIAPHYRHGGSGGLNQVRKQLARAIRLGHAELIAQDYADSLARQRTAGGEPRSAGIAARREREARIHTVQVVRSRFIFDDYFAGDSAPQAEAVHAECIVGERAVAHSASALPRYRATPSGPLAPRSEKDPS